ncbi:hypothetical protein [Endozoicomonas sp. Mp262]|uniref:hypothetical protein n=1 Tax=Endozoicomonas sp. Mp262 TaxID=2919499 RepID=UPI0021D94900
MKTERSLFIYLLSTAIAISSFDALAGRGNKRPHMESRASASQSHSTNQQDEQNSESEDEDSNPTTRKRARPGSSRNGENNMEAMFQRMLEQQNNNTQQQSQILQQLVDHVKELKDKTDRKKTINRKHEDDRKGLSMGFEDEMTSLSQKLWQAKDGLLKWKHNSREIPFNYHLLFRALSTTCPDGFSANQVDRIIELYTFGKSRRQKFRKGWESGFQQAFSDDEMGKATLVFIALSSKSQETDFTRAACEWFNEKEITDDEGQMYSTDWLQDQVMDKESKEHFTVPYWWKNLPTTFANTLKNHLEKKSGSEYRDFQLSEADGFWGFVINGLENSREPHEKNSAKTLKALNLGKKSFKAALTMALEENATAVSTKILEAVLESAKNKEKEKTSNSNPVNSDDSGEDEAENIIYEPLLMDFIYECVEHAEYKVKPVIKLHVSLMTEGRLEELGKKK